MDFDRLGIMIDCSRNSVMSVPSVKRMIDLMAKMGYNMLQLYTEDTYELPSQPCFGYMRGRYSCDEVRDIDAYAKERGIELVPCIQTLAHLNGITRWPDYSDFIDCDDILLVGDERSYKLIDDMFGALESCFTTRVVNIGMDEAWMLGLGKYLRRNGYSDRFEILLTHLRRVVEIASAHGFSPYMWSDMFYNLIGSGDYYDSTKDVPPEVREKIPGEVGLIYWDYYSVDGKHYDSMMKCHKQFDRPIWFAGGGWTWTGFAPHNKTAIKSCAAALRACRKNGIRNAFLTLWGDDGGECTAFAALPAIYCFAQFAQGITKMSDIKKGFLELTGISMDRFCLLDEPNNVAESDSLFPNPSKYMLYNDLFSGFFDCTVKGGEGEYYASLARRLNLLAKDESYGCLFASSTALCRVLELKYELGVKTRTAYRSGDKAQLEALVPVYKELAKRVRRFHKAFTAQWMTFSKPHGFEVQDARLGGLAARVDSCRERIEAYIAGSLERIDELDEDILTAETSPTFEATARHYNSWKRTVSVSRA